MYLILLLKLNLKTVIFESLQTDPQDPLGVFINCDATSIRQLTKWGMQMIQGCGFDRVYKETGSKVVVDSADKLKLTNCYI